MLVTQVRVVQADHHQGHIRYGDYGGRQCTGIVMYALAFSKLIPCASWDTQVLNQILSNGTEFYKYAINRGRNKTLRYLDVSEVIGEIQVMDQLFIAQYGVNDISDSMFQSFISLINEYLQDFVNSNCNMFIAADYSYGLIKQDNLLYFVDSHSKDDMGMPAENGYGGIRIYQNVNSLANYILSIHAGREVEFELTYISIIDVEDEINNIIIYIINLKLSKYSLSSKK